MIAWIDDDQDFPPTRLAWGPRTEAPGLLAAGPRPDPRRLRTAYRRGIFPWYSPGQPPLWWSPDPRMVLPVADFRLSRSLRKHIVTGLRGGHLEIRVDTAFERVIDACAHTPRAGQDGTWIVPEVLEAYRAWHREGAVHAFETWWDGELVGGLYGVGLGRMFFGESMFAHRTDASKMALSALVAFCRLQGIALIDCQQNTGHLASLGAREWDRAAFEAHLRVTVDTAGPSDWSYDPRTWLQLDPRLSADVPPPLA